MSVSADGVDFLHPDNVCGRTLLTLVARGSAILAELLRLSDHIPPALTSPDSKYSAVLHDFRYLKSPELYEQKIDGDVALTELDEEFRESHSTLLERFYRLFESIYRYYSDWVVYLEELHEGVFVQHTIENVLEDREGGQLMCEALYLYGVMLLLLDRRIEGSTREKIIISHHRYKGVGALHNFDEVVKLCRSTGYTPAKRPPNYPEDFFSRLRYPVEVVLLLISRLRADDVYNHTSAYPSPQHRSIAYAAQSSMLYVLLYFVPELLHKREAIMREVIDKHFPDNWVLAYYMGFYVDLQDAWTPYKAASSALKNIMSKSSVEHEIKKHSTALTGLNTELDRLLTEGVLTSEFVLSNPRKLIEHCRNCNYTLRWLMLHRTTTNRAIRELIVRACPTAELIQLCMHTAQFEWQLKEQMKQLLDQKQSVWDECKRETKDRLVELSTYYSGEKELTRVKRNESLVKWFKQLSDEIDTLDYNHSTLVGRKMTTLIQALEEVTEFDAIDQNLQVKQFLSDCVGFLRRMVKTVNINNKVIGDLDIISDFAYAWEIINDYTPFLHDKIKNDPLTCLLLRSTFLKLASILNLPLIRISQANSADDVSVADKYSSDLIAYVRSVLAIVPASVFQLLDGIINLQNEQLKTLPTKLERKFLLDYAQLDIRFNLSQLTHQISVFTQGILAIKTTIMGIIALNPKMMLEQGIRKELVNKCTYHLHDSLQFPQLGNVLNFEERLNFLGKKLDGFKQSFNYIQDYINCYGLKIWQEELSRIINYNVEQECNSFLRKKIYDWQSNYQSDTIPIPTFDAVLPDKAQLARRGYHNYAAEVSVNFMGRLTRELLHLTHVKHTVYIECMQGWYEKAGEHDQQQQQQQHAKAAKSRAASKAGKAADDDDSAVNKEVVGIRTFSLLMKSIGIYGLTGVDKLICFMLVKEIADFVKMFRRVVIHNRVVEQYLLRLAGELHPLTQFPLLAHKLYDNAMVKTNKLWPLFVDSVVRCGQMQLIRRQIANELNFHSKIDSKNLNYALDIFNQTLINDLQQHYNNSDTHPNYPGKSTTVLADVSALLEMSGINNPLTRIYITTESLDHFPLVMFLFTLSQLQHLTYNPRRFTLEQKAGYGHAQAGDKSNAAGQQPAIDGAPLVIGLITLLKQFHSTHTHTYLAYLGQYVRAHVSAAGESGKGGGVVREDVAVVLLFLDEFCKFSHVSRKAVEAMLPSYIFDRFPQPADGKA